MTSTTTTNEIAIDYYGTEYNLTELRSNGTVTYDGIEIVLMQPAYADNCGDQNRLDEVIYAAKGIDALGNIWNIVWDVTEDRDEDGNLSDDESNRCDWEHPTSCVISEAIND